MKNDSLKQFVALRAELLREQGELVARLAEIEKALGAVGTVVAGVAAPARRGRPPGRRPGRPPGAASAAAAAPKRRAKRAKNALSLREVVLSVTKDAPLSRQDLLKAVQKNGYVFTAKDPLNSLSTLLYSDKGIKNYDGKFGPA